MLPLSLYIGRELCNHRINHVSLKPLLRSTSAPCCMPACRRRLPRGAVGGAQGGGLERRLESGGQGHLRLRLLGLHHQGGWQNFARIWTFIPQGLIHTNPPLARLRSCGTRTTPAPSPPSRATRAACTTPYGAPGTPSSTLSCISEEKKTTWEVGKCAGRTRLTSLSLSLFLRHRPTRPYSFVSCAGDGSLRVWDASAPNAGRGNCLQVLRAHEGG